MASTASFTFDVSSVTPASKPAKTIESALWLSRKTGKWVESFSGCSKSVACCVRNSFIGTGLTAFNHHYPLALSPDDIWMCILQGVALHVRKNSETLRDKLVGHAAKETITVRRDDFVKGSPDNDWASVVTDLSDGVRGRMSAWQNDLEISFSTTTEAHRVANRIVILDMMEKYFDYDFSTCCGIPQITLLGTVDDWVALRQHVEKFGGLGLEWWMESLLPVLDRIVETRRGTVDVEFWKSFLKERDMSGGPYITGWVNVLFPYLDKPPEYNYDDENDDPYTNPKPSTYEQNPFLDDWLMGPTAEKYPLGLSSVPFKWHYFTEELDRAFLGGFIGIQQDGSIPASPLALRPEVGWAVLDPSISRDDLYERTSETVMACCDGTFHGDPDLEHPFKEFFDLEAEEVEDEY